MKVRVALAGILSAFWGLALFAGILSQSRGAIIVLAALLLAETVFWKWKFFSKEKWFRSLSRLHFRFPEKRLLNLYEENTEKSDALLISEIQDRLRQNPLRRERELLLNLLPILELRKCVERIPRKPKEALLNAFILNSSLKKDCAVDDFTIQDIADAATTVSGMFWKVYRVAAETENPVSVYARNLLEQVVKKKFEIKTFEPFIESLTDSIQREGGLPFLVLNLISQENWDWAKPLGQRLLTSELSLEEESRVCLYWMSEISWFTASGKQVTDFETTIRYLYHLCFINPERAGFLEIDSQFFSQFETVNELAKEGFLFKETLIDRVLHLWNDQPHWFDKVFRGTLQTLTQQRNKIYQQQESWLKWWDREKEGFEKEYLFVVEGNLHYSAGQFREAVECYQNALGINPQLRSALFNRLFGLAKLQQGLPHERAAEEVLQMKSLFPSSLYVVGNSFLLLGKANESEQVYQELAGVDGWARKTDYYRSTFCFENGLFEQALQFALKAHQLNPEDMSVGVQLSQCYSAVGKKLEALEILKKFSGRGPEWLNYYKFTLERDSGRNREAHETLLQIPLEYFDDPEELEAALDFAKNSSDLNLLRRLKSRG